MGQYLLSMHVMFISEKREGKNLFSNNNTREKSAIIVKRVVHNLKEMREVGGI